MIKSAGIRIISWALAASILAACNPLSLLGDSKGDANFNPGVQAALKILKLKLKMIHSRLAKAALSR